jgi:hypothetical protein
METPHPQPPLKKEANPSSAPTDPRPNNRLRRTPQPVPPAVLKRYQEKEEEWIQRIIQERLPLWIRKVQGQAPLENAVLLDMEAEDGRQIAFEVNGERQQVLKIDCVFLCPMTLKEQVEKSAREDTQNLPRFTYKNNAGEERWSFPRNDVLKRMSSGPGGIFLLADKHSYRGRIAGFSRWNFFLSLAKECEVLVFKHACCRWNQLKNKRQQHPSSSSDPKKRISPESEKVTDPPPPSNPA